MNKPPVPEMIAFLVGSRFPDHRWLRDPARLRVRRSEGNAPELPEDQRLASVAELEAYEAELNARPAEEVSALYDEERRRRAEEARRRRQTWAEAEERDRFFNRPSAYADFAHWSKAAYWTIDESVALILGRAPDVVNWEAVHDYAGVSPFARRYASLRDLALRSQDSGQLSLRIEPRLFLDWAKGNGIDRPVELERQVMAVRSGRNAEVTASPPPQSTQAGPQGEKPLLTRERDTLLKLVIGMAVTKYGFDPQGSRGPAVPAIINDLDALGITLDPKTVRKWLMEGADLLPRDYREKP